MTMNIKILGNGGAINNGLPYNAFAVNQVLLCEMPPDIMLSLYRNDMDLSLINTIYISHLHGDHVFGFPFFVLAVNFLYRKNNKEHFYTVVGPGGLKEMMENLVASAFSVAHPCFEWMKEFCTFVEIDESSKPHLLEGYQTSVFKLNHFIDTYGFSLTNTNGKVEFAYIADTLWCDSIDAVLSKQPQIVLIDLNGKADDPEPVHLSMSDLEQRALQITGENTLYYGTHLKEEFNSTIPCIRCARPGMVILFAPAT